MNFKEIIDILVRRTWDDNEGNQTAEEGNAFLSTIENSGSRFTNQNRFPESSPTKTNQERGKQS